MSEPDLGTRLCKLCQLEVPAKQLGRHVLGHGEEAVAERWPGGTQGYLNDLLASIAESMDRAEGDPEIIRGLRVTRSVIEILRKANSAPTN